MPERIDDPTFENYSWTDDERRMYYAKKDQSTSGTEAASAQQGQAIVTETAPSQTTPPTSSSLKSWNDITTGIAGQGGFHFNQDGKLYYKQGDQLYHAAPEAGGDYSVSQVPEAEARGIVAKEINSNGQAVFARGNHYTLYGDTVYGIRGREDGSSETYALSPHEDEYVYNVARTKAKVDDGLQEPLIDPIDMIGAGAAKAGITAARASGGALSRAWAAGKAGGVEMIQDAATQPITNPVSREVKERIKNSF